MKERIKPFYEATSDTFDAMGFGVLDFSARGCSSRETAEVGGMAHLLSFVGSDNIPAIMAARRYYDDPMAAFSVAATEHSVTTSWGRDGETDSIEYLIDNMMPKNGVLSMVADTYNVYDFVDKIAMYQDRIANKGGTVVIRPDSGDMRVVLQKVIADVRDKFWTDRNVKGYLVPRRVKVLQGDGINENSVVVPYEIAQDKGVSADAIMTGSGGGLMQANIDRDTCKFAFKASNVTIDGVDVPIAKDPITDPGKRSKQGRMTLVDYDGAGSYRTITAGMEEYEGSKRSDMLRPIYEDGKLFNMEAFSTIRERLANQ
jgi:nicotinamide phosphoribosyltransferase